MASRSGYTLWVVLALVVAAGVAGWSYWAGGDRRPKDFNIVLHNVERDDFALTVTERGEVESAGVTEVISEVKAKNTPGLSILRIVPEGTAVKKGDFLVELDSSALREERTAEQILVNTAAALVVQSRNVYETALIAKEEYLEGTYVQERQTIESEVFVAEENLSRAEEYHEFSKRLAAKGYINQLQLEADKFAVEKSRKELDAAKTKLNVLDNYTKAKMLKTLESDIVIAKAKWESDKNSLELEEEKLKEMDDQIAKCTLTAPKDGTVTYAHNRQNWGGDEFVVKEGAVIRERQAVIRLPDPTKMRVALNVNESLIQYIRQGMPATIAPIGTGGRALRGSVQNINQYAEPGGWRKANVKEYKALVTIDDPAPELRSGMTASVTIRCEEIPNAIQAPVQAIYAHGKDFYAFVFNDGAWEARPIKVGPTNDKFFVIEQGLAEGDRVAMNPRAYLEQVKLPELAPENKQQVVQLTPKMPDAKPATDETAIAAKSEPEQDDAAKPAGDAAATEPTAG
ncbi:efflux RND transporter periplasmic adaptor subunit [Lacipirellula limnantheis]|uniref:efflux RND transporter periplasmic adaptor subunit n=1 Tax=Lacipirellula limnantheis TaxID=2528024 RepID=UPI00143D8C6C|nr:HlyD family efflux transporter periplasmic adaptor subunit [Lacipirellula limnantheis]